MLVRTSPANVRAIQETVDALKNAGHECVEFSTTLRTFVSEAHDEGL